ncbi:MAG: hypothetical protein IJU60_04010 [Acholeplasmatales bacterium]|nr:hypothetical protein [Acholeplasmatales bacterium]
MKNFLSKKAKLIYLLCGVFSLLTLILSLGFMTQYRYLRVNYMIETNRATGEQRIVIGSTATLNGDDQRPLFDFVNQLGSGIYDDLESYKAHPELEEFQTQYMDGTVLKEEAKMQVLNYKKSLDNYNNMIVIFSVLSLVMFALMFVFGNNSRRIYYKSNLIAGIVLPGVIVVLNLVLIISSFSLMNELAQNYTYYNLISVLQNPDNRIYTQLAVTAETNSKNLATLMNSFDCNALTFVLYDLLFAFVLAYNVFLIVFAILKYKWTAQRRAEVIANSKIVGELI